METEEHLITIMEYGTDGNLHSYTAQRGRLPEEEASNFFSQLVTSIEHCHSQNCVHGDIKLNNCVLKDKVIKLIDFNMSKEGDGPNPSAPLKRTTFCGTSAYIAPEMVLNRDYEGKMADVFSLGVCLYVMVTGEVPFDSLAGALYEKYTIPSYVSDLCCDLIRSLLVADPAKRTSLQQIKQHPWMNNSQVTPFEGSIEWKKRK